MEKLVRDMVPGLKLAEGENPKIRRVDGKEYDKFLIMKLIEEGNELLDSLEIGSSLGILEELADVIEVVNKLKTRLIDKLTNVETVRFKKGETKGKFDFGFVMEVEK